MRNPVAPQQLFSQAFAVFEYHAVLTRPPSHALAAEGWAGSTCKVPHISCGNSTLACMNGGQCLLDETVNDWFCKCPPNLRGRQCQLGVNECKEGMFW
jgi:hypothetical protein